MSSTASGSDLQARVDLVPHQAEGVAVDVRDRALLRGPFGLHGNWSRLILTDNGQSDYRD